MKSAEYCLLCLKESVDETGTRGQDLLSKQLKVVFILGKLLELPSRKLEQFLEDSGGDNPECWLKVCRECGDAVQKAERIYEEMMRAQREFREVQQQIVRKLKDLLSQGEGVRKNGRRQKCTERRRHRIYEECQSFVVQHNYMGIGSSGASLPEDLGEPRENVEPQAENSVANDVNVTVKQEMDEVYSSVECGEYEVQGGVKEQQQEHELIDSPNEDEVASVAENSDPDWDADLEDGELDDILGTTSTKKEKKRKRTAWSADEEGAVVINGIKMFRCPVEDCQQMLKTRKYYKRHKLRRHSGVVKGALRNEGAFKDQDGKIKYRCLVEECGKVLACKKYYEDHKKYIHLGVPRPKCDTDIACELCGKVMRPNCIYSHRRKVHGIGKPLPKRSEAYRQTERKKWKCPHCDFMAVKQYLTYHIKMKHTKAFTHFCDKCGKGTGNTNDLKQHQAQIHFICSRRDCKLQFEGLIELREHQVNVHGREHDVYGCPEEGCDKVFTTTARLTRHKKIHEYRKRNEMAFVCELCGKHFAMQDYLYFHNWSVHKKKAG